MRPEGPGGQGFRTVDALKPKLVLTCLNVPINWFIPNETNPLPHPFVAAWQRAIVSK